MTPRERYQADIQRGLVRADPAQTRAIDHIQHLYEVLHDMAPPVTGWWQRLLQRRPTHPVRGLYLWGGPGRGKTYLVDSFFECLPFSYKRRVHYHRFMQEIHEQLRTLPKTPDPLKVVGRRMAQQMRVLCLDEFHVLDIADAMLLAGLLQALFHNGITLVATSNIQPDELYMDGLQRDRFLYAIDLIKAHTHVVHLDSPTDFRCEALDERGVYLLASDEAARQWLEDHMQRLAPTAIVRNTLLRLSQREVPVIAVADDVIWLHFADLCDAPLWARDYLEIAQQFHTVLISDVPVMDEGKDDAAKRFMHLIDALYDHQVKLVATAAAAPDKLYQGRYLSFGFARTASRLVEMAGHRYLSKPHRI